MSRLTIGRGVGCAAMTRLSLVWAALGIFLAAGPSAAQDGAALYRRDCAACHDMGVDRAPAREALQAMTAERVLNALENGPMISMASRETGAERRAIAQFVTGKALSARDLTNAPPSSA